MTDPTPSDAHKARQRRNVALAGALVLFVVVVFVVTMVRLSQNVAAG